jgi:hypothetical protein
MFGTVRRRLLSLCGAGVIATGVLMSMTVSAYGYGNTGGEIQLYQATVSQNCDNVSVCGPNGLGGFWAWAEFGQNTSTGALVFDAEATGCGHLVDGNVPGSAGATHFQETGTWGIFNLGPAMGNWIVITSETDYINGGPMNGQTVTVPSEFTPVGPAMKVKINTAEALGFTAPGVTFNVTVTPMHSS